MSKDNINIHNMTTRSKSKNLENYENKPIIRINEEMDEETDEHGNLKNFIVYDDCENDDKAREELNNILYGIKPNKKMMKKKRKKDPMGNMFMNYLILKATEKANEQLKKKKRIKVEEISEETEEEICEETDGETSEETIDEECEETIDEECEENEEEIKYTVRVGDKLLTEELDESSDEEFLFEYDEYDEELEADERNL